MQEYSCQLYEGLGLVHEGHSFSDYIEGEITSLVLFFLQYTTTWDEVQDYVMLWQWGLDVC